jgi:uncharacterized spore protein YtfJ
MQTIQSADAIGTHTALEEVFKSMVDHAGAKTVYGDPVSVGGKTIVPVAKIRYGFGGGSGRKNDREHGGGGGGGMVANPIGVVEITEAQTRFIPISLPTRIIAGTVILGLCLGWLLGRRR